MSHERKSLTEGSDARKLRRWEVLKDGAVVGTVEKYPDTFADPNPFDATRADGTQLSFWPKAVYDRLAAKGGLLDDKDKVGGVAEACAWCAEEEVP